MIGKWNYQSLLSPKKPVRGQHKFWNKISHLKLDHYLYFMGKPAVVHLEKLTCDWINIYFMRKVDGLCKKKKKKNKDK